MFDDLKDSTVSFVAAMDAGIFTGDTIKERYESLYIKLVEMSHVLISKGATADSLTLTAGRKVSEIFESSHTRCFVKGPFPWETGKGKFDLGRLWSRWQHFLDDDMVPNRIEIGSDKGKAVLLIVNGDI